MGKWAYIVERSVGHWDIRFRLGSGIGVKKRLKKWA